MKRRDRIKTVNRRHQEKTIQLVTRMQSSLALRTIKILHTLIWAFFAGCIVAIPVFTYMGRLTISGVLIAAVMLEVFILGFNSGSCPLTGIAARYTEERQANFDIYLPEWLARYNKIIFGTLYISGAVYTLIQWLVSRTPA